MKTRKSASSKSFIEEWIENGASIGDMETSQHGNASTRKRLNMETDQKWFLRNFRFISRNSRKSLKSWELLRDFRIFCIRFPIFICWMVSSFFWWISSYFNLRKLIKNMRKQINLKVPKIFGIPSKILGYPSNIFY